MDWIKASDTLPPIGEEVYLKFRGFRYVGYYEDVYKTFRSDGHQLFTSDQFNELYWSLG